MFQQDSSNSAFALATEFINKTSRHVFLTGKAGTGKTTFLKYIKEQAGKNSVVVAPTGVAAINAGGVTMHSFFQLPFGPFVPGNRQGWQGPGNAESGEGQSVTNRHSLFKHIRFTAEKKELLQELELLIIDEVSMVRCDMLDAMDAILRYFRQKPSLPFGGVQLLFIGDLYQLPPVVPAGEWEILKDYYDSPFFFSAKVIAEMPPLYIELRKIYRQNEQPFIDLLNRVRNNELAADDLQKLNSRYRPCFNPPPGEQYITLCTHNNRADTINLNALQQLQGKLHRFTGSIEGDFPEQSLPTDKILELKEGAQVMFIKNDSGADRKYYNGRLAVVKKITDEAITVGFADDQEELAVNREIWRNIRYTLNRDTNSIEDEELGSFTQYPLRLAWAITIHKSQGLTFEKAVIDAGKAFAAGQVYVALSRCTSFSGIVLRSKLEAAAISTDERVKAFAENEAADSELEQLLRKEQERYEASKLLAVFEWDKTVRMLKAFLEQVPGKKIPEPASALTLANSLYDRAAAEAAIADRFRPQLQTLLENMHEAGGRQVFSERMTRAVSYFSAAIANSLLQPLRQHINAVKTAPRVKQYLKALATLESQIWKQLQDICGAAYGETRFGDGTNAYWHLQPKTNADILKMPPEKTEKGASQQESLRLFKKGSTIREIARSRNLAESTVAGHLAMFVRSGALDIHALVSKEKLEAILAVVETTDGHGATPIKEKLGEAYSYAEIRAVLNYWQWLNEAKATV